MSLVLAPIHEMMYKKVLRQDGMSEALLSTAEDNKWSQDLRVQVEQAAPAADVRPLVEIIDSSNIHGWLNGTVVQSERRLARVAAGILENHPERLDTLRNAIQKLGEQETFPQGLSAEDIFERISNALLDGMPCDRSLEVESAKLSQVQLETVHCSHATYWAEQGLSPEIYYVLRDAWLKGVLAQSGYSYKRSGLKHRLYQGG